MAESSPKRVENLVLQTRKNLGFFGKGLNICKSQGHWSTRNAITNYGALGMQ